MKPILFHVLDWPIRTYGVTMAVAFLAGILLARRRARAAGLDPNLIVDLAFYVIIASIAGARATYVAVHWDYFRHDLLGALRLWDGGLAQYGGIAAGVVVGLVFFARRRVNPWLGADLVTPSVALGVAIGRIGCFMNGCCFGKPCALPWAVTFPQDSIAGYQFPSAGLHPTQIYESLAALAVLAVLLAVDRRKPWDGFLLWLFVVLLAASRALIDPIRYYERESMAFERGALAITVNQVLSVVLIAVAIAFMAFLSRRRRAPQAQVHTKRR